MRTIIITEPDKPGNVILADRQAPVPGVGEVLIDVAFAGCNFADTMCRRGVYPHAIDYPFAPGFEISGTVASIGPQVTALQPGDRVAGYVEPGGGYAEQCVARPEHLMVLPDNIAFDTAAAFPLQAMTAWHMLLTIAGLHRGHREDGSKNVLINAIGGGVGLFTTQIAKHLGATIYGTVGSDSKKARPMEFGATTVINRNSEDFVDIVLEATGGQGVDVVIDSLGAKTLDRSFACTRPLGHVVSIGEAEGKPYENIWERCLRKSLTFTRFHLGHVEPGSKLAEAAVTALLAGFEDGWLKAPIADIYPLEKALDMQLALESASVPGKLLLEVGGN